MTKILHICTWDTDGGAAIAAKRHMEAMRYSGYDSEMLVLLKQSGSKYVHTAVAGKWELMIKRSYFGRRNSRKFEFQDPYADWSFSEYGFDISEHPKVKDADIVILHWINSNFLSIKGIGNLMSKHPNVYWFLHDMWPMTGGCHYTLGCEKFKRGCHRCPMFNNHAGSETDHDASYTQFHLKMKNWVEKGNIKILAPSEWLCNEAKNSKIFGNRSCEVLRNVVPTNIFHPLDKKWARKALNLPEEKKLILFGAASATNAYKGWPYLSEALQSLRSDSVECIVFGNNTDDTSIYSTSLPIHPVGRFKDPLALSVLYNAADVFVTPSIADNYPNVLIEAMACGTPCIGFNIGGIPEIIRDKVSGVIAQEVSCDSLSNAILHFFDSDIERLSKESFDQIQSTNSFDSMKLEYYKVFNQPI